MIICKQILCCNFGWNSFQTSILASPASRLLCKHWRFTSEFLSYACSFCVTVVFILSIAMMVNQFFYKGIHFPLLKDGTTLEVWLPSKKLTLLPSDFTMQSFVTVCGDKEFKIFLNMLLWKLLMYHVIFSMHLKMVFHCFFYSFFISLPYLEPLKQWIPVGS